MPPKIETLAKLLEKAKQETLTTAAKVPDANRFLQLGEGKATPMWLLGHMTNTINSIVLVWTLQGESILTREQAKLFAPDFAGGAPPTPSDTRTTRGPKSWVTYTEHGSNPSPEPNARLAAVATPVAATSQSEPSAGTRTISFRRFAAT